VTDEKPVVKLRMWVVWTVSTAVLVLFSLAGLLLNSAEIDPVPYFLITWGGMFSMHLFYWLSGVRCGNPSRPEHEP
jgi:hypothetical protein